MERMHPELMVLQAYEGKDIAPGLDLIRKQLHHSEQEGATQLRQSSTLDDADVSARFRAYGTSTNRGIILNTNGVGQTDPTQPLRAINVVSTHAGAMSEAKAANIALQEALLAAGESPEFMKQGLSLNNIHGLSPAANKASCSAMLAALASDMAPACVLTTFIALNGWVGSVCPTPFVFKIIPLLVDVP
jgi:hypothetical protein